METWTLFSNRKSCRTISGYVLRALRFCSSTTIQSTPARPSEGTENKMKVLVWPSQSWDLNPTEMLWWDLKHTVHADEVRDVEMKSAAMTNPSSQPHVFSFLYELTASLFHLLSLVQRRWVSVKYFVIKNSQNPPILQLRCVKLPRAAS